MPGGSAHKDQHDALGAVIRQIFTANSGKDARRRLGEATGHTHDQPEETPELITA